MAALPLLVACLLVIGDAVGVAVSQKNSSSCFPSDLEALSAFAAGVHATVVSGDSDHTAMNESWRRGHDCCFWKGVTCTASSSHEKHAAARVTALSLDFVGFSESSAPIRLEALCNLPLLSTLALGSNVAKMPGSTGFLQIPECLGEELPSLQDLRLSNLHLKGPVPSSFARLLHLQFLDLSSNPGLSGTLPNFHTPRLQELSLDFCSFSGPLPTFHAPLLQSLSLTGNRLSSTLRQFTRLSNLSSLTDLDLSSNSISGHIPSSISRLLNLENLYLEQNSLSGALPDSLCQLSHLIEIHLSENLLSVAGLLHPEYCAQLTNLMVIDLSVNNFTGPFPPWIGHFSSLTSLDLSSNRFASLIPDEWQNLRNLNRIHLGTGNSLNGTRLPAWLFRLPQLSELRLASLGLQSEDVLCSTRVSMLNSTLEVLDVSGNNITGRDLLECFALHSFEQSLSVSVNENPLSIWLPDIQHSLAIHSLSLSTCNLTGFLNDQIFQGCSDLVLSHNNLHGKIPTNLTGSVASSLDLSNNYFTGFDSHDSSFPSLDSIELSHNSIAGDLATVLKILGLNCTAIGRVFWHYLHLSYNELVGQIPSSLAECGKELVRLYLDHNNLTGQIPENFGKFSYMESLRLNNNRLDGTIPAPIITKGLLLLEMSYNELEGDLKTLLQRPSMLVVLVLAHNRISGSIPPSFGNFTPALCIIDVSHNNLAGNIPQDLYFLPSFRNVETKLPDFHMIQLDEQVPRLVIKGVERSLTYVFITFRFLDLSENYLEGPIPSQVGDLAALLQLNLSHNSLSGPIPAAFGKVANLETLDLSFNRLQGSIPASLSKLSKLAIFNVSFNEALVGSIPQGSQLENSESYRGDPLLCGRPILQACPDQVVDVTNAPSLNRMSIKGKAAAWMDEWVSVPGLCLGGVVGFFGILWLLHGPRLAFPAKATR